MKKLCILVVLALTFSCFQVAFAQNIYLGIPGYTNGVSTNNDYKDYSVLTSLSYGFSNPVTTTGTGGGAGKPSLTDIGMTKNLDLATTQLMKALLLGRKIDKAEIVVVKSSAGSSKPIYKINLTGVSVTSYSTSASSDCDGCPAESLSLAYETIEVVYYTTDAKGAVISTSVKYDLKKVAVVE